MRRAPSGGALIEQHGAMSSQVEIATRSRGAATARAAVEVHDWRAVGVADLLDVQDMAVPDIEALDGEGLRRGLDHHPHSAVPRPADARESRSGRHLVHFAIWAAIGPDSVPLAAQIGGGW